MIGLEGLKSAGISKLLILLASCRVLIPPFGGPTQAFRASK